MNIGDRIKTLRKKINLTQEELAKKLGTTPQTIYKYEKGIVTNIPLENIEKLSKILNVTTSFLMGWEKEKNESQPQSDFPISLHEKKVVTAYREQPNMQSAVDRLLGIEENVFTEHDAKVKSIVQTLANADKAIK